jgi:hypothetical protein
VPGSQRESNELTAHSIHALVTDTDTMPTSLTALFPTSQPPNKPSNKLMKNITDGYRNTGELLNTGYVQFRINFILLF